MLTLQGGDSLVGGLPIIHITYQQYIANPSAYQDPDVIVHISGFPTAGNMPADYVGYDSNLNMEDIGNIATKAIAKVEPSDTALYLHNVGTGFINKDGNYCITDVQISVGGTITLGTNCHVVDGGISSKLVDSNTTATDRNGNIVTIKKRNGFVLFHLGDTYNVTSVTDVIITLPVGYRPLASYSYYTATNSPTPQLFQISINTNGEVTISTYQVSGNVPISTDVQFISA